MEDSKKIAAAFQFAIEINPELTTEDFLKNRYPDKTPEERYAIACKLAKQLAINFDALGRTGQLSTSKFHLIN